MTRIQWPAAERNKDPILAVLQQTLPTTGLVLEIASGTGQHAAWFAKHLVSVQWQPSDPKPEHRASIAAWQDHTGAPNLRQPIHLDVLEPWPVEAADALVNINMIHISPWSATLALFDGAARVLAPGAPMVVYGPYLRGADSAASNLSFSESLKERDPTWGVRELDDVVGVATDAGMVLDKIVEMPANNLAVCYRRGD